MIDPRERAERVHEARRFVGKCREVLDERKRDASVPLEDVYRARRCLARAARVHELARAGQWEEYEDRLPYRHLPPPVGLVRQSDVRGPRPRPTTVPVEPTTGSVTSETSKQPEPFTRTPKPALSQLEKFRQRWARRTP